MNKMAGPIPTFGSAQNRWVGETMTTVFLVLGGLMLAHAMHVAHYEVPRMLNALESMSAALPGSFRLLTVASSFVTTWWFLVWPILWLLFLIAVWLTWRTNWRIGVAAATSFMTLGAGYAMLAHHCQVRLLWFLVHHGQVKL